jgi:hypothetical protein
MIGGAVSHHKYQKRQRQPEQQQRKFVATFTDPSPHAYKLTSNMAAVRATGSFKNARRQGLPRE